MLMRERKHENEMPTDDVAVRNSRGPATDDILLGDYGGKVDDD